MKDPAPYLSADPQPPLLGPRLVLRTGTDDDAAELHRIR